MNEDMENKTVDVIIKSMMDYPSHWTCTVPTEAYNNVAKIYISVTRQNIFEPDNMEIIIETSKEDATKYSLPTLAFSAIHKLTAKNRRKLIKQIKQSYKIYKQTTTSKICRAIIDRFQTHNNV